MATYRFCGYGITNNNGIATLDYDANGDPLQNSGLVGTGAGELDIVASLDDPNSISDSSLQSETYGVLDCIYYDDMSSDTSANYYINTNNNTIAFNNDYIVITANTSTSGNLYVDLRSLTNDLIGKTVNIEVDVVLNAVSTRIRILKNGSSLMNSAYTTSDGTITLQNVDLTETANSYYIRLETRNTAIGDSIQFKNLKVYLI